MQLHHSLAPAAAAALSLACGAFALHIGDIGLFIQDGAIYTAPITPDGLGPPQQVFQATFGDTGSPEFTSNPGFDCAPGTFTPGDRVGFNILDAYLVWNGVRFVPTDPAGPLNGERLKISFLTLSVTTGAGAMPGFDLAVQPDGGWHRHLNFTILPAPGAGPPDVGVYLFKISMYDTNPDVGPSAPVWLVMNYGASDDDFAAATSWAEAQFGPSCPADLNGDGVVNGADLGVLIGGWGGGGVADLNGDGVVDGADLGILIGAWGACP